MFVFNTQTYTYKDSNQSSGNNIKTTIPQAFTKLH